MISRQLIDDVISKVESSYLGEAVLQDLRQQFTDVHFTYCMDDDIGASAKPVVERSAFNVYLVDGREHCLCLTNDHEVATGIVLAEVFEDDEDD